ncbi:MAG: DUF6636 domain-containing protein [Actinomycetes bacterium]
MSDSVRCDIVEHSWTPPPRPDACFFDWGPALGVEAASKGRFVCASDTVYRPEVVVPYGRLVRNGAMSCSVVPEGVTCRSGTGHGFFVSKESYELF